MMKLEIKIMKYGNRHCDGYDTSNVTVDCVIQA